MAERHAAWLCGGALALLLAGCSRGTPPPAGPGPAAYVRLAEPRGEVEEVPLQFSWEAIAGADEYKVTISDADAVWPLLVHKTKENSLTLTPKEGSAIVPGRIHVWEVEALDSDGLPIATGGVRFRVAPPEPAPPPGASPGG
jgi:hypothetical protein